MAGTDTSYYMRYYIYSRTQAEQQRKIHHAMSVNDLQLKKVIVNGVAKPYTDELKSMKECRYSDAVVVAKGDKREMKFTR